MESGQEIYIIYSLRLTNETKYCIHCHCTATLVQIDERGCVLKMMPTLLT